LNSRRLLAKTPYFVLSVVFAVITFVSQSRTAPVTTPGEASLQRIVLVVCHNIVFYLYKMVWPVDLTPHYGCPEPLVLTHPMVLAGAVGTIVLILALLVSWRWTRALLVGWLFFFVGVFPTLGVVGFTDVIAADRFVYLPGLGLVLVVTWLTSHAWTRWGRAPRPGAPAVAIVLIGLALAGPEAVATRRYLSYWQDTERLHRRMVTLAPHAPESHYNLGVALVKQGRLAEAIDSFSQAVRIRPSYPEAHYNLCLALLSGDSVDLDGARQHFAAALQSRPNYRAAHANLGAVLLRQGHIAEAIEHYRKALALSPEDYTAHYDLAVALAMSDADDEAIRHCREALRLRPSFAPAHEQLGRILERQGRLREAIHEYRAVLRLTPNNIQVRRRLMVLQERTGP
jgi:Flp pilus assembly protein TadD